MIVCIDSVCLVCHLSESLFSGTIEFPRDTHEVPQESERDVLSEWCVCVVRALSADPSHRGTLGQIGYPKFVMDAIRRLVIRLLLMIAYW